MQEAVPIEDWRRLSVAERRARLEGALRAEVHAPAVPRGLRHFLDDDPVVAEAAAVGFHFVARRGDRVLLEAGASAERPAPFALELLRALRVIRLAERARHGPPRATVASMRARGRRAPRRGPVGLARLRRAIAWLDAAYPAPNCYRRTLAEVALDAGAADATLVFGLDVGRTGHVAFEDVEDRTFDVAFAVPPE